MLRLFLADLTTGDTLFAECSELCRVSKHEHSTKRQFAECRTRQSRHSAKNNHRQNTSSDAGGPSVILCRVLAVSPRQTCCLCRVLQAWHSAKRFLCRVPIPTLGKVFLFFFIFVFKFFLWRCLGFRHHMSQLTRKPIIFLPQPLRAMTRHLDKFHDFRTSFAFYIIKKHFFNKLVVMFHEIDV